VSAPATAVAPAVEAPTPVEPPSPPVPQFEEVILPSSSVIGLQLETSLSSETARMEDRVEARVTRDVLSGGRLAIPAGARVIGAVTQVDRGGKLKERARLAIRFHTVVLGDGSEVPLRTEPIMREGDPPAPESSKKIGGAAVGGAILGAILGGGKGAMIGGMTGAGGGAAAVMAGGRNPATFSSGTIVTARLASPVSIQVEKQ
jgi:type IV secretory pathway VirB10-like protein